MSASKYTFDKNDKSWYLHFCSPDPQAEKEKAKAQVTSNGTFIPLQQPQSDTRVCKIFLCGMCQYGGLCHLRHELQTQPSEPNTTLSEEGKLLLPLVVTKSQILRNIGSLSALTDLYVVLLHGVSLRNGVLCQQLMRVDNIVDKCFNSGKFMLECGLALSTEGAPETEIVTRIDAIADHFDDQEKECLVERYLASLNKFKVSLPSRDTLMGLEAKAQVFRQ